MPERLKGRDQTIRVLPRCSRLGVGLRADSPLPQNPVNTETRGRRNSINQGNTVTSPHKRNKLRTTHVAAH